MAKKRVAVLISGRGSNMVALIEAARSPAYPAEIALVLSNRPEAGGLARAARRRHRDRRGRSHILRQGPRGIRAGDADGARAAPHRPRLPRRLHAPAHALVRRALGRPHAQHPPALLPAFKGLDTHARALAAGVKIHGATVHFVVPEMDSGPIVAQGAVPVREDDDDGEPRCPRAGGRASHLSAGAEPARQRPGADRRWPLRDRRQHT